MGLNRYMYVLIVTLVSMNNIGILNGEDLSNTDNFIVPCGPVTCNVIVEYCVSDITGSSECLQCEGMCARARVGTNERYIQECLDICPVYWQLQLDEEARNDGTTITSTPQEPTRTTDTSCDDNTITGLTIGLALSFVIIIALVLVIVLMYVFVIRPMTKKAHMSNEIQPGDLRNNVPLKQPGGCTPESQPLVDRATSAHQLENGPHLNTMNGHVSRHTMSHVHVADNGQTKNTNLYVKSVDDTSPKLRHPAVGPTVQTESETRVKVPAIATSSKTGRHSTSVQTQTGGESSSIRDDAPIRPVHQISDLENDNKNTNKFVTPAGNSIVIRPNDNTFSETKVPVRKNGRTRTPKLVARNGTIDLGNPEHQTQAKVV